MVYRGQEQAESILRPVLEKYKTRQTDPAWRDRPGDGVKWLLDRYTGLGKELTVNLLAQDLLFVTVAAIQTSAAVGCSILFDMMDHPASLSKIRSEISQVKKACGGNWDRNSLARLIILDSFMKESKRLHTFIQGTLLHISIPSSLDEADI
jgi:cytochrome P450